MTASLFCMVVSLYGMMSVVPADARLPPPGSILVRGAATRRPALPREALRSVGCAQRGRRLALDRARQRWAELSLLLVQLVADRPQKLRRFLLKPHRLCLLCGCLPLQPWRLGTERLLLWHRHRS